MTSRLDRLLLLLDTGSSSSVRNTAAKQLAQLAAKSVTGDVGGDEDIKKARQHAALRDPSEWSELMSVVARILPYLHSKNFETRSAAGTALAQLCTLVPVWEPPSLNQDSKPGPEVMMEDAPPVVEFPHFSVRELLEKGSLLLASSGREFARPAGIFRSPAEVQKARKEAMGRLGLDFLESVGGDDGMDWEKELNDDQDVEMATDDGGAHSKSQSRQNTPAPQVDMQIDAKTDASSPPQTPIAATPSPSTPAPEENMANLSARERNRLKRKRKAGNTAFVAPPPQSTGSKYAAAASGTSGKARLVASNGKSTTSRADTQSNGNGPTDRVAVDPTKGGSVDPKAAAARQSKALEVEPGTWVWNGVVKVLEVDLFSANWEARHGAALGLREVLKGQGHCGGMKVSYNAQENEAAHERWCNDLVTKLLCVFVLDRFGDFVSDQVIAPVREMVSQTLASLLLHMPRRSILHVHEILLSMIKQDFPLPPRAASRPQVPVPTNKRGGAKRAPKVEDKTHIWEVRHVGLLGIKYEVAVRDDIVNTGSDEAKGILIGLVEAAVLGLADHDDDVRSVAATCITPVVDHLVAQLPEELPRILAVLWSCLGDMQDDLSSSVGAVMDLLGKLVAYDEVIAILADPARSQPMSNLAPTLYSFFRHTIPNVRLAVVKTLYSFMTVPTLSTEWVTSPFLRLLFQNLIVEERTDIRDATLVAWRTALTTLRSRDALEENVPQQLAGEWYAMEMTLLNQAIDTTSFYHHHGPEAVAAGPTERHNVDKSMVAQDMSLITYEIVWKARIAAAKGLAQLLAFWSSQEHLDQTFRAILLHYLDSPSMLQKVLAAMIIEEWAREYEDVPDHGGSSLASASVLASDAGTKVLAWLQGDPPTAYYEMAMVLGRIRIECIALMDAFRECRLGEDCIPQIPMELDIEGTKPGCFNLDTAETIAGETFDQLKNAVLRNKKKELAKAADKRALLTSMIEAYVATKGTHDYRVSAAFASAFVALKFTPEKVSPIVKGVMNGIKNEENVDLQRRSAVAVAAFIEFCTSNNLPQPPDKIVKNLCTFLCQDVEQTPSFPLHVRLLEGILSSPTATSKAASGSGRHKEKDVTQTEDVTVAKLSRRGAGFAFVEMSSNLGAKIMTVVPNMWQSMAGGLLSISDCKSIGDADKLMEKQYGQDVIDSLSVLQAVIPSLHVDLRAKVLALFSTITLVLRSRFAIVRKSAALCFSTICHVVTQDAMRHVVEEVLPFLGNPVSLASRQGAMELLYHIVQMLDIKALPYVIFMIVPILGRMSDINEEVRATATYTFASLVKMVPLEAGLPDPPGFSDDLLKQREVQREFLTQLLDGTKVDHYELPISIKAELRKYQQDGVNWLAFLAKYQLHGILCDDMGLGKTLQSICILASKHHERRLKYDQTKSPESIHLPSLIVCPPTLTGHWFYEITKYSDNLRPLQYTGNARERAKLLSKASDYDVIITSYEVVRNDISNLQPLQFHYCILDEGHVIKNAKTKLTKAVKCIQAQHRLILSGTPIQNNVLELWSLFDFLMPGFLGTESSFSERFSKPILSSRDGKNKNGEAAALALEALHKQVLPFLLRRLKEDVLNDLPPKIIQDYYCELSDLQKYLYDNFSKSQAAREAESIVKSSTPDGAKTGGNKPQQHIFQSLQYLRKLCNHPALVFKNDKEAAEAALSKISTKGEIGSLNEIHHAPKLLALRQLLTDCGIGGGQPSAISDTAKGDPDAEESSTGSGSFSQHRVLIFCQLKQMLDIIETDLFKALMPSVTYMRLDGTTDVSKRHAIVQTFNADPSIDCLLLTTHVGGLGLTLTGADTVIFVEHDWNPMKDLQAMDRAHRLGQKKVVNVYRLITKGTLEEKIMGLQRFKLNIANSVVTQQNSGLSTMGTDLVLDLFKRSDEPVDAKKQQQREEGALGTKNVLEGLEDLPSAEEYEGLDLGSFMGSLGK